MGTPFDFLTARENGTHDSLMNQRNIQDPLAIGKMVVYNLVTTELMTTIRKVKAANFAKLQAVYQVLKQENLTECHIYTDSGWQPNDTLASPTGKNQLANSLQRVMGGELWSDIWGIVQTTNVSVFRRCSQCSKFYGMMGRV